LRASQGVTRTEGEEEGTHLGIRGLVISRRRVVIEEEVVTLTFI
jgi:hypothetical protein